MKKRKKTRKVSSKPDEYFQLGPIEMARFGNVISLRSNMTEAGHKELLNKLVQSHEQKKNEIDELIVEIRGLVSNCYPLSLLCYAYQNFFLSIINNTSEVQLSHEDVLAGRELEYILSVIASTQIEKLSEHENDPTEAFLLISEKIHKLYSLVQQYFIYFIANKRANAGIDEELAEFIFEAQLSRFYRGERYSIYEIDHLKEFCSPHNDVFMKLFNVSINDFLDGLNKIRLSLTVGIREALSCLEKAMTEYERIISERREDDNSIFKILEENQDLKDYADKGMGMLFGNDLFNLSKLTSWPLDFLKKLSWTIGECDCFFGRPLYTGWPTVEMPISKKPFICINGQYYCFDYYNLFDNIYRTLEKLIMTEEPSY
ncbi:MAG TPA: hypothetical protein PKA28_00030 [Methylomusa anaerophila]|uniref:Uncharacterized protein n=1 Tax=Methylomusa anaerophila TaxID=1930071 RepID=A0A348AQK7_9FIRM|nr:hypothetical protein [Methylomusa anaerophila]BBB93355.1 hypothetical protein MAMMFC1_04067 [Methylomusa anaerophila]HML86818.1 hypothetical protein [Methylomusa anaerophila]